MEQLFTGIVPGWIDELTGLLTSFAEIFAGGVLISVLVWVLSFTIREVFRMLDSMSREEG